MSRLYLSEPEINDDYAFRLASWVSTRTPAIPWREFGGIPTRYVARHGWKRTRDFLNARWSRSSPFWWRSSAHAPLFARLVRRRGPAAGQVFRLLCMGDAVDGPAARAAGIERALEEGVESGVLRKTQSGFHCPVTLMPFRDSYYLTDAQCLVDGGRHYNIRPAATPTQAGAQLRLLERMLTQRSVGSALEIGCGTGVVAIELKRLCGKRLGVDVNTRALAFARANQALHSDPDVRFSHSDLFDQVGERTDLVVFNPWQPSESNLPLIERFVSELPARLTREGRALLVLDTAVRRGNDESTAAIGERLREASLEARRFVEHSYLTDEAVRLRSLLWIRRVDKRRSKVSIRTSAGLSSTVFRIRSLIAAASPSARPPRDRRPGDT